MNEASRAPSGDAIKSNRRATIAMVLVLAVAMIGGLAMLLLFSK